MFCSSSLLGGFAHTHKREQIKKIRFWSFNYSHIILRSLKVPLPWIGSRPTQASPGQPRPAQASPAQASPGQNSIILVMLKIIDAKNWFYCIMLFTSLSLCYKMDAIASFGMIASSLEQVETCLKLWFNSFAWLHLLVTTDILFWMSS